MMTESRTGLHELARKPSFLKAGGSAINIATVVSMLRPRLARHTAEPD